MNTYLIVLFLASTLSPSPLACRREEGGEEGELHAATLNARRMKADNMPVELIAKYTGLTTQQIELL